VGTCDPYSANQIHESRVGLELGPQRGEVFRKRSATFGSRDGSSGARGTVQGRSGLWCPWLCTLGPGSSVV
jgi:hypothetical protein